MVEVPSLDPVQSVRVSDVEDVIAVGGLRVKDSTPEQPFASKTVTE